jgi:hypothetical protein
MKAMQSHSTAHAESLRSALVPSWGQVFIYILLGLITLVALNIGALWTYFNSSVGVSQETANAVISNQFDRFSNFAGNILDGRLAPMLFWGFLGVITYMVFWLIKNTAINVRNDLTAENYKHPFSFSRQKYWQSIAAHKVFLVCSIIFLSAFVYLSLVYWLPILARVFYAAIYSWEPVDSGWKLLGAILATAFLIYFVVLLARITRNAWRWVTSNL